MAGGVEARQVVGIVAEVGIHLENVVVAVFERPLEASDVGGAETQFPTTLQNEQTVGKFFLSHHILDNGGSPVRRTVVDNEDVEAFF